MKAIESIHFLLFAILCSSIVSCQQIPEDDNWISDNGEKLLKVNVRSAGEAEISYPLYLYAFNGEGKLSASQTIADAETDMALPLSEGDFQIVAISGTSDSYTLPNNPTLDDVIKMSDNKGAETPLMVGRANVEISDASTATALITLSYVVAALNVELKEVPDNVSAVQLSLSPLHSSLTMGGEYGGDSQKVKIDCTSDKKGNWSANTVYIFPGNGAETVFSIYFKTEDGTEVTYGYTYKGIPKANNKFNVTGTYAEGVIVGGSFDVNDWEGSINVEFEFGSNVIPDNDGNDDEDEDNKKEEDNQEQTPTGIPEVGTIWNDLIVADISENEDSSLELLLMTLDEWEATTSQVNDVISSYSVNGISEWRLPTHEEASLLRSKFSEDKRLEINELIKEHDASHYGLDGVERYLCNKNGTYYSFKFAMNTTISKAGEKRSYYVRLVKTYRYENKE